MQTSASSDSSPSSGSTSSNCARSRHAIRTSWRRRNRRKPSMKPASSAAAPGSAARSPSSHSPCRYLVKPPGIGEPRQQPRVPQAGLGDEIAARPDRRQAGRQAGDSLTADRRAGLRLERCEPLAEHGKQRFGNAGQVERQGRHPRSRRVRDLRRRCLPPQGGPGTRSLAFIGASSVLDDGARGVTIAGEPGTKPRSISTPMPRSS